MDDHRLTPDALRLLERAIHPAEQLRLREGVEKSPGYYRDLLGAYLQNPFLRPTRDELEAFAKVRPAALAQLIAAREAAIRSKAPRYVVFCMPKSGSSFIQSALQHALQVPFVSLTHFVPQGQASYFGMNGREQELDVFAMVRAITTAADGFVAQHHTRYTLFLGLQTKLYGLTPIVTVRNALDALVSFDDMMMAWRGRARDDPWITDVQFALPLNYGELAPEARYRLLAPSFGVWAINFYLSWKRGAGQGIAAPLVLRYEDQVLAPERLIETLRVHASMSEDQAARLEGFVRNPDKTKSRFNVGRRGRGAELVPADVRAFLADYASAFREELSEDDLVYLVGAGA